MPAGLRQDAPDVRKPQTTIQVPTGKGIDVKLMKVVRSRLATTPSPRSTDIFIDSFAPPCHGIATERCKACKPLRLPQVVSFVSLPQTLRRRLPAQHVAFTEGASFALLSFARTRADRSYPFPPAPQPSGHRTARVQPARPSPWCGQHACCGHPLHHTAVTVTGAPQRGVLRACAGKGAGQLLCGANPASSPRSGVA